MQSLMEVSLPFSPEAKVDVDTRCLSLLLKCLRIMENATFLSKDNQVNNYHWFRNLRILIFLATKS